MNTKTSIIILVCAEILILALTRLPIVPPAWADPNAADANCPEAGGQWPSLGGDYTRSGLSPNEGLIEEVTEWAHEVGSAHATAGGG